MKTSATKILSFTVILLLVSNLGLVAYIMFGHKGGGDRAKSGRQEAVEMMTKELDLSADQQKDLKQKREDFFKNNKPLFDSIRNAKVALFSLVKDPATTDSLIQSGIQKVAALQSVADKLAFEYFRGVRAYLKPDQQPKYDEFLKKMLSMRGRRDTADRKK